MRSLILPAVVGIVVFFIVIAISISLGYYLGVSAGTVFGSPAFGEYTQTSVIIGGVLGFFLGVGAFGVSIEAL